MRGKIGDINWEWWNPGGGMRSGKERAGALLISREASFWRLVLWKSWVQRLIKCGSNTFLQHCQPSCITGSLALYREFNLKLTWSWWIWPSAMTRPQTYQKETFPSQMCVFSLIMFGLGHRQQSWGESGLELVRNKAKSQNQGIKPGIKWGVRTRRSQESQYNSNRHKATYKPILTFSPPYTESRQP